MEKDFSIFIKKDELLLSTLENTYIRYYTLKSEYLEARDEFIQTLHESEPSYLQPIETNESTKTHIEEQKVDDESGGIEKKTTDMEDYDRILEKDEESNDNKECNSLFKKLVLHIHPDKNKNIPTTYFNQARKALERGKFGKLCFLIKILNIPIGYLTEEEKEKMRKDIEKKENKINHMNKTYPMIMKNAKDVESRERIMQAFIQVTKGTV
jgi:hypothetical protein